MKRNKSILWAWALSYICLLLIPLTTVFINYYSNIKALKQEYFHAYELTLHNVSTGIDSVTNNMQQFYHYILQDASLNTMITSTSQTDSFYYHSGHFKESLLLYHATNDSLDCAVYNSNMNFISSVSNGCSITQYYEYLRALSSVTPPYEEWIAFISGQYDTTYFISTSLSTDKHPNLVFANTLNFNIHKPTTIFITVPLTALTALTDHMPANTYLVLQTSDHNLYYFDNSGMLSDENMASVDGTNQLLLHDDSTYITAASSNSNITYHLVISKAAMAANLHNIQKNFVVNLTLTLLLSLVGMFILLKLNYRPISELLLKFNIPPASGNELTHFASIHEQLQKDYHSSRLTMQHQAKELFGHRLLGLLKGRISTLDLQQYEIDLDLNFCSDYALIGFWLPMPAQQDLQYDELNYFIVDNIFCELFNGHTFFHIEDGRYIFYLFDLKNDHSDTDAPHHTVWNQYASDKVNYLCDFINERCNFNIVGVVSEPINNIGNCKFLYRKVLESFDYQNISGGFFSIDTHAIAPTPDKQIHEHLEYDLNNAISNGDLEAALDVSNRLFTTDDLPFFTQKVYVFDSFIIVTDIINNYITNPSHKIDALNYVASIIQAGNVDELKKSFDDLLIYVFEITSPNEETETKDIILKIRKYVAANYMDQFLSVGSIADALDRNPKYISRVFKEETGEGLLDYINSHRIAKAKELILSRRYTLKEVSEMVGYTSIQAFRRAFIKLTGETPSKFNENM